MGATWNEMYRRSAAKLSEPREHARITEPVLRLMWNRSDSDMTCVKVRREIFRDACVETNANALSLISLNRDAAKRIRPYAKMAPTLNSPSTTASIAYLSAMGDATLHSFEASSARTEVTNIALMNGRSFGHRKGSISHSSSLCCFQKLTSFCFAFSAAFSAFCFAFSSYPEGSTFASGGVDAGLAFDARPRSISVNRTVSCETPLPEGLGTTTLIATAGDQARARG
mmetsp:Transcript_9976/g.42413  ORF Transcript_9976/g.42413 Transcript_9976/m.42413 type:complete len:227 (+) Transcript_9976:2469-3149(+)